MSSNSIYPHTPYFYIIEHTASGKKYAGCRYAKGCNPAEFMTEDGYCTSSSTVKKIIEEHGLDAFITVEIKTIDEVGDVYAYETKFLTENDCAKSDQWLNQHNNTGMSFGTEEFINKTKETNYKNLGVEWPMQSSYIMEKSIKTLNDKYGVRHCSQIEEVKEKKSNTCTNKYGVDNYTKTNEYSQKCKLTSMTKYGVEHHTKSPTVKRKVSETCTNKYGVDNYFKSTDFKNKSKQSIQHKYEVDCISKSEEIKSKKIDTHNSKYGMDHYVQTEEFRDKSKATCLLNYGVDNYSKTEEAREYLAARNSLLLKGKPQRKTSCICCKLTMSVSRINKHFDANHL